MQKKNIYVYFLFSQLLKTNYDSYLNVKSFSVILVDVLESCEKRRG